MQEHHSKVGILTTAKVGRNAEVCIDGAAGAGRDAERAAAEAARFIVTLAFSGTDVPAAAQRAAGRYAAATARAAVKSGGGKVTADRARRGDAPRVEASVAIVTGG